MTPPVRVDHVGIAVHDVRESEPLLELLGARKLVHERDEDQGFTWAYYALGGASRLELIEPIAGRESFLTAFLDARGPGLHHVTLEVASLDATVTSLEAAGVRVVDEAAREGYREAFVPPGEAAGVLFQLIEYDAGFGADHGDAVFIGGEPLR